MRSELVLRVGLVHGGRVLDERLIRAGDVTVGTDPSCTLVLPGGASAPKRRQIVAWSKRRTPRLVAHGLEGRMASKTGSVALPSGPGGAPLMPSHRGKLVVGDSVVLFQCLAADDVAPLQAAPAMVRRRLRGHRRFDWPILQAIVISAVVLGGSGGGLAAWWHETGRFYDNPLTQERHAEQLAVAEVTALIVRERPKPPENPDTPEAPDADAIPVEPEPAPVVAEVPTPKPRDTVRTRRSRSRDRASTLTKAPTGQSVRDKTFLGVLGKPDAEGTVAGLVNPERLAGAFEDTDGGVQVASTDDGAAVHASPRPERQRERYVKVCTGDDCVGGPLKTTQVVEQEAKGDDDETKPVIRVRPSQPEDPIGVGRLDPGAVKRVFVRRRGGISSCYERYLRGHAATNGIVKVRFTIGTAGRITDITTVSNSFGDRALGDCIIGKVKGWRFPAPTGGSVTFAYPLVLEVH